MTGKMLKPIDETAEPAIADLMESALNWAQDDDAKEQITPEMWVPIMPLVEASAQMQRALAQIAKMGCRGTGTFDNCPACMAIRALPAEVPEPEPEVAPDGSPLYCTLPDCGCPEARLCMAQGRQRP